MFGCQVRKGFGQIGLGGLTDGFGGAKTDGSDLLGEVELDAECGGEGLDGLFQFLLEAGNLGLVFLDVDLPAGETAGEAGVVALAPDGEGKVFGVHEGADAVVIYADGGGGHPAVQGNHKEVLAGLLKRGVGFGCMHYGVEVVPDQAGALFNDWLGGHYAKDLSCNPIWEADYLKFPEHPVTRGVQPFKTKDEWYFNMRFREGKTGVKDILVATPSDAVRDGPYVHPKGPYPHIQAAKGKPETMMWAVERPDGGRGFGFTGGHFHLNWQNDDQRRLILNALVWLAKLDVPAGGIDSAAVSDTEAMQNLDEKKPAAPRPAAAPAKKS